MCNRLSLPTYPSEAEGLPKPNLVLFPFAVSVLVSIKIGTQVHGTFDRVLMRKSSTMYVELFEVEVSRFDVLIVFKGIALMNTMIKRF